MKEDDWLLEGTEEVIPQVQAKKEILTWFNLNNIARRRRIRLKDTAENLMLAMVDGDLSLSKNKFKQKLSNGETLTFNDRLNVGEFQKILDDNSIDDEDGNGRLIAAVTSLTGKTVAEVKELKGDDKSLANSIALFLM
jgi:hypothetical protein